MPPDGLDLPPCAIPRPGDKVTWFNGGKPRLGTLEGFALSGRPVIKRTTTGYQDDSVTLASIRVANRPGVKAMWQELGPDTIWRPTADQREALSELAECEVGIGLPAPGELATEIWERGFEVFFTGESVRRALMQEPMIDAELITTMPKIWLEPLLAGMYVSPSFDQRHGRFLLGELAGNDGTSAYLRLFRSPYLDDQCMYGASFADENGFNGLTFDSIYFDPKNDVLIDPTGDGLIDIGHRCLRPVPCPEGIPELAKHLTAFRIIRLYLEGSIFCPGKEQILMNLIQELRHEPDLASGLDLEVFAERTNISEDSTAIRKLLEKYGMLDLWINTFQPAILRMRGSDPDGGTC